MKIRLVLLLALAAALLPLSVQADSRGRDGSRRFERPPAERFEAERDRYSRRDAEEDERSRGRLTREERQRLRRDVDEAGRDIYQRRRR